MWEWPGERRVEEDVACRYEGPERGVEARSEAARGTCAGAGEVLTGAGEPPGGVVWVGRAVLVVWGEEVWEGGACQLGGVVGRRDPELDAETVAVRVQSVLSRCI